MLTLKRPAVVISLNMLLLAVAALAIVYVARHQASAPHVIQVTRVEPPREPLRFGGSTNVTINDPRKAGSTVNLIAAQPDAQVLPLAVRASKEYRAGQYESAMRDSDLALNILTNEKESKVTHMVSAQIALIAARAAAANGSRNAEKRYLTDVRNRAQAVMGDPKAFLNEKIAARDLIKASRSLDPEIH